MRMRVGGRLDDRDELPLEKLIVLSAAIARSFVVPVNPTLKMAQIPSAQLIQSEGRLLLIARKSSSCQ